MRTTYARNVTLVILGFGAGVLAANFPRAHAAIPDSPGLAQKRFYVSIDEIRQNFVLGDEFSGRYRKTVTLSDGTTRDVELTPMIHDGKRVVEFKDNGFISYMGLNGSTTDDTLMVQLRDRDALDAELHQNGGSMPAR